MCFRDEDGRQTILTLIRRRVEFLSLLRFLLYLSSLGKENEGRTLAVSAKKIALPACTFPLRIAL